MHGWIRSTTTLAAMMLAALALAAPALASSSHGGHRGGHGKLEVRGLVKALTDTEITVERRSGALVTCKLGALRLPAGVEPGTSVRMRCRRSADGAYLVRLRLREQRASGRDEQIEIKGAVSAVVPASSSAPGSVEVAIAGLTLRCLTAPGSPLPASIVVGARVEMECRDEATGPALTSIKLEDDPDSVVVRGVVEALTPAAAGSAGSIRVSTGTVGVECAIPTGTQLAASVVTGARVSMRCGVGGGVLTLETVAVAAAAATAVPGTPGAGTVGDDEFEIKGAIEELTASTPDRAGSLAVAGVRCTIGAGTILPAGLGVGSFVEIKCELSGKDWLVVRVHAEDGLADDTRGDDDRGDDDRSDDDRSDDDRGGSSGKGRGRGGSNDD